VSKAKEDNERKTETKKRDRESDTKREKEID